MYRFALGVILLAGLLSACQSNEASRPTSPPPAANTTPQPASAPAGKWVAKVNNVEINELDVQLESGNYGHSPDAPPESPQQVLDRIIREELAAQKAIEAGLDADPTYQEKIKRIEAQRNQVRRRALSELYLDRTFMKETEISDAEIQRYFEANVAWIRTEANLWQILMRDEAKIAEARQDLDNGASFEEVAKKYLRIPPTMESHPWELGYLKSSQMPDAWRSAVQSLEIGAISPVITGPNHRFWILKLVDRRENPEVTLESIKPILIEKMKGERRATFQAEQEKKLRETAKILYQTPTPEAPPTEAPSE